MQPQGTGRTRTGNDLAPPQAAQPGRAAEPRRTPQRSAAEPPPSNEHRIAGRRGAERVGADTRAAGAPVRGTATRAEAPRVAGAPRTSGQTRTNGQLRAVAGAPVQAAPPETSSPPAPSMPPVPQAKTRAPAGNGANGSNGAGGPAPRQGAARDKAVLAGAATPTGRPRTPRQDQPQRRPRANGADPAIGTAGARRPATRNGMEPAGQDSRRLPVNGGRSQADISNRLNPVNQPPDPDARTADAVAALVEAAKTAGNGANGNPAGPGPVNGPGSGGTARPNPQATGRRPVRGTPGGPERREEVDPISLTAELEPISEMVVAKRKVDATLARFSAVHDEMAAEEEDRRSRRKRLMPWLAKDDDLEEALSGKPGAPTMLAHPVGDPAEVEDADFNEAVDDEPAGADEPEPPEPADGPPAKTDQGRNQGRFGRAKAGPAKISLKDKRVSWSLKALAIAAAIAVLALTGVEWGTQNQVNNQIQEVAALDENSPAIANGAKQSGDENFLFVGTNARAGVSSNDITTDTVTVAHIPADRSRVEIVSFPGNLQVTRPACQGWNNSASTYAATTEPPQDGVRLDAIYAIGGPRCVTDTVQDLSGLRINHFVGMDFQGFQGLAGALPPISLCTKGPVIDDKLGTIIAHAGTTTLSGQQALNFVRADQVEGDPAGEYAKIARQQRFLAAVLRQVIGQNLLTSPSKLNDFLNVFSKSTFGANMDVSALLTLAQSLQGVSLNQITFITLPTTGQDNAQGEAISATDEQNQLFNAIIGNAPLPGTAQPTTTTTSTVTPANTKIQVLNGGDSQQGIAGQTANSLKSQGFTVVEEGNAPHSVPSTVVRYATQDKAQAQLLASAVPKATLQEDPSADGAVELILGADFDGHVVAASSSAATTGANSPSTPTLTTLSAADTSCA
ncbi:MAG TPA: LCP family protein [Pseudonocardiaceae bacterium]|jgi:LCP family protein required for cell wall assembly|nr:LCP family protein [Pseudonocardiaceae bacterium]